MMAQLPFFVYGTLLPSQPNDWHWGKTITQVEPATFPNGRLYTCGPFPMLIEGGDGPVVGALITVAPTAYQTILHRLDQLEAYNPHDIASSPFHRVQRQVHYDNSQRTTTAWVYLGQEKFVMGEHIPHGNWVAYVEATQIEGGMAKWWREHGVHLLFGKKR